MKPFILPFLVLLVGTILAAILPGTGDHGDSIQHFLIAKNSWAQPTLFFDHWGKPLFTLLASPFAQFGFTGIKVFNVICFSASLLLLSKIGKHLDVNGTIAGIVLLACPMLLPHVLSGLTEPLFAFFLLLALLFCFEKKWMASAIVLSFLPFVRSEGWIMLIAFTPFFLHQKEYKSLPLLLLGTVIYSLLGMSAHHDVLWVFTKTPYINQGDNYGSGNYLHFINQLFYWCGLLVCALFVLGLIRLLSRWQSLTWKWVLLSGLFFSFLGAHSIFWGSGLFHSMGLARVLICVLPLLALIAATCFQSIKKLLPSNAYLGFTSVILIAALAFPLLSRKQAKKYTDRFQLHQSQVLIDQAIDEIKSRDELNINSLHCTAPWAKLRWQEEHGPSSSPLISNWTPGNVELILWDGYFSKIEEGIGQEQLQKNGFKKIWEASNNMNERNVVSLWVPTNAK